MSIYNKLCKTVVFAIIIAGVLYSNQYSDAYVSVKGYYRKNGTYVQPYVRSEPNGLKYDNYGYTPSQGLYNKTYSTKDSNWDTPTYYTDPDYYVGKNLYDSGQSGSSGNGGSVNTNNYPTINYNTTPSCPLFSSYNSLTKGCDCYSGYIVDNSQCVYANTYCSGKYGYGSEYSSLEKNCKCKSGYTYNSTTNKCITYNDYCQNTFGYYAESEYLYSLSCKCKSGYVFDETTNKCIDGDNWCSDKNGNYSKYDVLNKQCVCKTGYILQNNKCEQKITSLTNTPVNLLTGSESKSDYVNKNDNISLETSNTSSIFSTAATPPENGLTKPNIKQKTLTCEIGYATSLDKKYCVKIPNNAHAVNSKTDVWLCNNGYKEVSNICVKVEDKKEEKKDIQKNLNENKSDKTDETKINNENINIVNLTTKIVNLFKKVKFW